MEAQTVIVLTVLIFAAATLYSSVGHGGASGYLAAMALVGLAPQDMKPTALFLNILVSSLATFKFGRAGCFAWRVFWPFALTSVPLAYVGGRTTLPVEYYRPIVGVVLLFAAVRLIAGTYRPTSEAANPPPVPLALLAGGGIGLLSGLTGVGGGIFLSPLLLIAGWAGMRETAGVSAAFILVNSISGILGHLSNDAQIPAQISYWGVAALAGGWIGAELGSRRLNTILLRRLLGVVLVVAGLKMIFA